MRAYHLVSFILVSSLILCIKTQEQEHNENLAKEPEQPKYVKPQVSGEYHFVETFETETIESSKWVRSSAKKDDVDEVIAKYDGKWAIESSLDAVLLGDKGLVLKSKAKHSAISTHIDKPFDFAQGKPLIVQYEVKFQNALDCGGAYVKLVSHDKKFKLENFHDKTPFTIMFGPDKCGTENKYHFIVQYNNPITGIFEEKHAKKSQLIDAFFTDGKTHLFTLILRPDNTFQMLIDTTEVNAGSLLKDMTPSIIPDKEIIDPTDAKPESWDDREKIEDPDATKPDDWDESQPQKIADVSATMPDGWLEDESETISDPESTKPDDWDEDTDGEWEAAKIENPACKDAPGCGPWAQPMISNPEYKGKWLPPLIDNVNYQGKWEARKIQNPVYFEESDPFSKLGSFDAIGLELWSMTDSVYFDNFLITDDETVSTQFATDSWKIKKDLESANSSSDSVIDALVNATKDKPWLWALYVLVVLVPIVLGFVFCCSGSSKSVSNAEAKKNDQETPDDVPSEEQNEQQENEVEAEEDIEEEEIEAEEIEAEEENPSKSDLEEEKEKPIETATTTTKKTINKRRARKD